jgi:UDP-N-acetylmuramyl tripeptide synthase
MSSTSRTPTPIVEQKAPRRWPLRAVVAIGVARGAGWLSRTTGSGAGGTLPGRVLDALLPQALTVLSSRHRVVLVSGTNGKTTTTLLISHALADNRSVLSNSDGANLTSGILTTLASAAARRNHVAVFEVDEVALIKVLEQVEAEVLVLLNLSRDQLDRTSEVTEHMRAWRGALMAAPDVVVIANGDDALVVNAVLGARPESASVVWVAAGKPFRADASACPRCNAPWDANALQWACDACGLRRPSCRWELDGAHTLILDGQRIPLQLNLPGRANASNAVIAAAAATTLGVSLDKAVERMREVHDVAGRYARTTLGGRDLRLLLAKNPAGWLEALQQVAEVPGPVLLAVNARDADGLDPSWLWDVPFEALQGRSVVAIGERAADLAVRLKYAHVEHTVAPDVETGLALLPPAPTDILANYTAFTEIRRTLFPHSP